MLLDFNNGIGPKYYFCVVVHPWNPRNFAWYMKHSDDDGGFAVRTSAMRAFNCVPTDQALEQKIKCEAKSKGVVIGFILHNGALIWRIITRHVSGECADVFKQLSSSGIA